MSWIGGNCQGDRRFECTYLAFDSDESVCLDQDNACWEFYDNMGLVKVVDHQAPPPSGGGGW